MHRSVWSLRAAGAPTIHQLVGHLRSGALGRAFSRVVPVGHSMGSIISLKEAATYHVVDGVVVTGYFHVLGPNAGWMVPQLHPAILDPAFGLFCGLDVGYLTTRPGMRDEMFYHMPTTDPAMVAFDEATKRRFEVWQGFSPIR